MASHQVGDELSPFLLDVPGLDRTARREEKQAIGGSYGFVFKVTVGGVECIAKKLHSAYVNQSVSDVERQSITSKFRNECIILSKLSHPNVVKFIGVHCGPKGHEDLTLIMESLRCDLHDFLVKNPNIPLSLKVSMLLDVSHGLVYLHCGPPIIHRDLTARNILITGRCQAKIADLGVAKIVSIHQQLTSSHTQTPGQMFYMPPEALKKKAECTPKLDIFSFGHLTIFTANQVLPDVEYYVTQTEAMQREGIVERTRRAAALKDVGSNHCLYPIITECLYDRPEQRPTTRDLNSQLIKLSTQHPVSARQVMPFMEEEMAGVSEEVKGLQKSLDMKTSEVESLKEEKEMMAQEIRDLRNEIEANRREADTIRRRMALSEASLRGYEEKQKRLETQWVVQRGEIQLTGQEVGRGAWATVTVATFRGVRVAAKRLHSQIISPYNSHLFMREINMAARIRHPNLLQFIGATQTGELIILMELMPTSLRRELESLSRHNLMPLKQVISIGVDVARALNYLHLMQPQPLVHRDISSACVLLQPLPNSNWRAKVSGFGTVNFLQELQTVCPGCITYSAPEANDPSKQSPKMDIFSFGVLLIEMLTGEFPNSDNRAHQLHKILNQSLLLLIQRCLNHNKERRPSASHIITQLDP